MSFNDFEMLNVELRDGIAVVQIDNPPFNVLHPTLASNINDCFSGLGTNEQARAIVVTGKGEKAFCAGFDIKVFPQFLHSGGGEQLSMELNRTLLKVSSIDKPTIAAINGLALGGGLEIAMACDLRFAAQSAKMGQPEIKLGLIPGAGGTQRLSRLVGPSIAKELMYMGDPINSQDAFRVGLVNKVFDDADLMIKTMEVATKISNLPAVALRLIKQAVDQGLELGLEPALKLESQLFESAMQTCDAREGVSAFAEKRTARFKHN